MKRTGLLFLLIGLWTVPAMAQVSVGDNGTFGGRVYSDYYWMAQHHNDDIEGQNGFWFRRIYATYEHRWSEAFSSRLRLEMNSSGDFESDPEMTPTVKDAYLRWKKGDHQITAGISSTPTFGLTEDVWGYRSVEKSPQDLYDFGSSRDFGLSFQGALGQENDLSYHFFVGNGNSNRPDVNSGKKVMLSLGYKITDNIVVQGYADYNDTADDPTAQDYYTGQFFAGYRGNGFNAGALYSYQHRETGIGGADIELDLVSAFANVTINDTVSGYLRADHLFDPYPGGSDNSYIPFAEGVESTFMVAGADILLEEQIHLMPNIEVIAYGENAFGQTPATDVIPRLTLFYEF